MPADDCASDSDSVTFIMSSQTGQYTPLKTNHRKKSKASQAASPQASPAKKKLRFNTSKRDDLSTENMPPFNASPTAPPPAPSSTPLTKKQKYELYKTKNAKFSTKVKQQKSEIKTLQSKLTKANHQRNQLSAQVDVNTRHVTSLNKMLAKKDKKIKYLEDDNRQTLFTKSIANGINALQAVRDVTNVILKALNDGMTVELKAYTDNQPPNGNADALKEGGQNTAKDNTQAPNNNNKVENNPPPAIYPTDGTQDIC